MSQKIHDISNPNDRLGDALREAFDNQNDMNTELYNGKVDKVAGKGLSDNNLTDELVNKINAENPVDAKANLEGGNNFQGNQNIDGDLKADNIGFNELRNDAGKENLYTLDENGNLSKTQSTLNIVGGEVAYVSGLLTIQTQINAINTLLTSDNINLDTIQEIVDAIEIVQTSLNTILINNLTSGGVTKALTAEQGKVLKGLLDALTIVVNLKMNKSVYDPNNKNTDAFSMTNMVEGVVNKILTNAAQVINGLKDFANGIKTYSLQFYSLKNSLTATSSILGTTGTNPVAICVDNEGNLYIANYNSNNVTKITPNGVPTTFATVGTNPTSICIDDDGNIYTANNGSHNVTKITPLGVSNVFATVGTAPKAICVDNEGNLYTANSGSNNVTKITPNGVPTTFATVGTNPHAICVDNEGNLYTANYISNNVTKITPLGVPSIFAIVGTNPRSITIDDEGNVYTANYGSNNVSKITPLGASDIFATVGTNPHAICVDNEGNLYIANYGSNNVTKITPNGVPTTFATVGTNPYDICIDNEGNLYTANLNSSNVSKITPPSTKFLSVDSDGNTILNDSLKIKQNELFVDGKKLAFEDDVTNAAYMSKSVYDPTGKNADAFSMTNMVEGVVNKILTNASQVINGLKDFANGIKTYSLQFYSLKNSLTATSSIFATVGTNPYASCLDDEGNVYTVNSGSNNVTKTTPNGVLTTFATVGNSPRSICRHAGSGNLYVANYTSNNVTKITKEGVPSTFATVGTNPHSILVDEDENVYTANYSANTVTKITKAGIPTTFATVGTNPFSICRHAGSGNFYVANYTSNNVTKITKEGVPSTFATVGTNPINIIIDNDENVYTVNYGVNNITKITKAGIPTTFATVGNSPRSICRHAGSGNFYVANTISNTVTKITKEGVPSTFATVGTNPFHVISDDYQNIYVTNYVSNNVSKITPPSTKFLSVDENGNTILNDSLKIKESELFVGGKKLAFEEDVIKKSSLTTYYADNAAAITGGLVVGDMYVTPTGENRTVV